MPDADVETGQGKLMCSQTASQSPVQDFAQRCCDSMNVAMRSQDDFLQAVEAAAHWYASGGIAKYFRFGRKK